MKSRYLLLLALTAAMPVQAMAGESPAPDQTDSGTSGEAKAPAQAAFTTGVARGRDMLSSAISASTLDGAEVQKMAPRSVPELFRNIPGVRVQAPGGDGNVGLTIRGLPSASTGAKFVQVQEDGLPVLEFGDIAFFGVESFLRPDLGLTQVQSIRGGSASTFGSNSPGGVINLISNSAAREGGSVQFTAGLDYEEYRTDFELGSKLNDTMHFNASGFYRSGEGPRKTGYTGYKGGQFKLNLTKELANGHIRFFGKVLDDRTPIYMNVPVSMTGSNGNPKISNVPGFDFNEDTLLSRYIPQNLTLDARNNRASHSMQEGQHSRVKSFGVEARLDFGEWTVTDNFRYSDISGSLTTNYMLSAGPASAFAARLGGPGATLSYATGPNAGQAIASPAALNGNGLAAANLLWDVRLDSLDYVVNDMRASRVWNLGGGKLTTTGGFYKSNQTIDFTSLWGSALSDVLGGGQSALLDVRTATGVPLTQNGFFGYGSTLAGPNGTWHRRYDLSYDVNAAYGSLNFALGRLAIGGSIRYDFGKVEGSLYGADLGGGRVGMGTLDMNGDGTIVPAETMVSILPLGQPGAVNYDYDYISYSLSANYRVAETFSAFARYSLGGRLGADRIAFEYVDPNTGKLSHANADHDPVRQAEAGVKYRNGALMLNLTGFWAKTNEHNVRRIERTYRAIGLEFEGGYSVGPWSLAGGATYTKTKILADVFDASTIGNEPRYQPKFVFQLTPQYSTERFSVGAVVIGQSSAYTANTNQAKLPGFTTVNAFVQYRPSLSVLLSVNANNLFDQEGFVEAIDATVPASGVAAARPINGRTVSTSLRLSF